METLLRYPAEWERHTSVWLAWPSHQAPWEDTPLAAVQTEFTGLCRAIADPDQQTGQPRGEALQILVPEANAEMTAREALEGLDATFHRIAFGDIWLRDTGPIFIRKGQARQATVFRFNGWGEKFIYPGDDAVAASIAARTNDATSAHDWVLEGGSIETDGVGTILTTEECLLNKNRNPCLSRIEIEQRLRADLGAQKVLWLGEGLAGDHTDGHIDNLARFIGPRRVLCMEPFGPDDPNRDRLLETRKRLEAMTDATGQSLEVFTVPSPRRVLDRGGQPMPASHLNFYLSNTRVIVPMYPGSEDTGILDALKPLFPDREVVGRPSWNILHGGGSFHCITQHVPATS